MGKTMNDGLTGRALDEAAARAMGWVPSEHWDRLQCTAYYPLPHYPTDPARIDEMLAWLRGRLPTDEDVVEIDIDRHAKVRASLWLRNKGAWSVKSGVGSTIPEALARLVVAVKEAQP